MFAEKLQGECMSTVFIYLDSSAALYGDQRQL